MSDIPKLLPCPFCGGKAEYWRDHTTENCDTVACRFCGITISDSDEQGSCVQDWNTRTAPKVSDAVSALELHVLREMCDSEGPFGFVDTYYGLGVFAYGGVTKEMARAVLRGMTDRGLCQYKSGLFSDDGEPRGSGYAPTHAGVECYKSMR